MYALFDKYLIKMEFQVKTYRLSCTEVLGHMFGMDKHVYFKPYPLRLPRGS